MREIKFRGKFVGTGDWVYGDLIHKRHTDDVVMIQDDKGLGCDVCPGTVGQYTGLHDFNGNEIYEGDIVKIEEYKNELMEIEHEYDDFDVFSLDEIKGEKTKEFISRVFWEDGLFFVNDSDISGYYLNVIAGDMRKSQPIFVTEIIGNIHDNPELL